MVFLILIGTHIEKKGVKKMIEIINLRNEKPSKDYDVKIDRASGLGNPYLMKKESHRNLVCSQYKKYFEGNVRNGKNKYFSEALDHTIDIYKKYGKIRLFCWCAPKKCHGETIKKYLEESLI